MSLTGQGSTSSAPKKPTAAPKKPVYTPTRETQGRSAPKTPEKIITVTQPGMSAYSYARDVLGNAELGGQLMRWFQSRGESGRFTLGTQVTLPSEQELQAFPGQQPRALSRDQTATRALSATQTLLATSGYGQSATPTGIPTGANARAGGAAGIGQQAQARSPIPLTETRAVPGSVGVARGIPGTQAASSQVFPVAMQTAGERYAAQARYIRAQNMGAAPEEFKNILQPKLIGGGVGSLGTGANLTDAQAAYAARMTSEAVRLYGQQPTAISGKVAAAMGIGQESVHFEEAARYTGGALFGGFSTQTMSAFQGAIDRQTGEIVNPNLLPNMLSPRLAAALGISEEDRLKLYGDEADGYRLRTQAEPPAAPGGYGYGGYGYGGYGYPYYGGGGGGYGAQGPGLINWRIGL